MARPVPPSLAKRPASARSRAFNRPRQPTVSGNSPEGRRLLDLQDTLAARCGGWSNLTPEVAAKVRQVAELQLICELARQRALKGEESDLTGLCRLEGHAARAERKLSLIERQRHEGPALDDYLEESPA